MCYIYDRREIRLLSAAYMGDQVSSHTDNKSQGSWLETPDSGTGPACDLVWAVQVRGTVVPRGGGAQVLSKDGRCYSPLTHFPPWELGLSLAYDLRSLCLQGNGHSYCHTVCESMVSMLA